jgi:hypothetical protein
MLWGGCSLQHPLQEQQVSDLGHFEFRLPHDHRKGLIIGAPHGGAEPDSADFAKTISERTGGGLVAAYGFGAKRLSVSSPLVRSAPYPLEADAVRRGSVYVEFKKLLQQTAMGNIEFYVGIRFAGKPDKRNRIEVTSSGLTFDDVKALKRLFFRLRDESLAGNSIAKIDLAMEPLDKISWRTAAIKHHGALMIARRGLNLRLPAVLASVENQGIYGAVLSSWIDHAYQLVTNPAKLPQIRVKLMEHGRIELIPSTRQQKGVVIGAPHGTFDEHTAELVNQVSFKTGLAAVIAQGFTPTECGGWRINVNRPTERLYPRGDIEIHSKRAHDVYRGYNEAVLEASQGEVNLYIDIHQNGRQGDIEVATLGISKEEARFIKNHYRQVRDQVLKSTPGVASVDLLIEPLDSVEIGAWAAKAEGILGVAKKSLHFEFPLQSTLGSPKTRDAYKDILILLLARIAPTLNIR